MPENTDNVSADRIEIYTDGACSFQQVAPLRVAGSSVFGEGVSRALKLGAHINMHAELKSMLYSELCHPRLVRSVLLATAYPLSGLSINL